MESLIIVILVILILLLLLVVFIPAYLERLSRRNRALREQYSAELKALERDARRLERRLAPYTHTRSTAYRTTADNAGARLALLTTRLSGAAKWLAQLRCPAVYGYLLPAQHFMVVPGDVGNILADRRGLGRARGELAAAVEAAAVTKAALDGLALLPERLAADRVALARRLAEVEAAIHRERDEGIEALDHLTDEATNVRRQLGEWERVSVPGAALPELDGGAVALETAAAALTHLEAGVADVTRERVALDERLRGISADLDNAQATTKAGPGAADAPPQVRPLLRRAAALLNESAPNHRRRGEFAAAGADVVAATRLITLARDLTTADRRARVLEERDDGVSLSEAIGGLRRDLTELLDRLGSEGTNDSSGMAEAAMAARAAQTRTRAETLTRQQDEVIAGLEREATATRERLERAWDAGQHLLPLADDDPLSRRRARLLDAYQAAQRRPAALEEFRRDVATFEGVLGPWVTRLQSTRMRIGRLRGRLPDLIDAALATAAPWNCLAEHVAFIQQRAADFETAQARFAAARYRREAESLMDEIDAIESDIEERFAQLNDWAGRLRFLEADVDQIITLALGDVAELPAEHPERPKWDRALRLVTHHTQQAHAALRYEDASVALLRAADLANKLAL